MHVFYLQSNALFHAILQFNAPLTPAEIQLCLFWEPERFGVPSLLFRTPRYADVDADADDVMPYDEKKLVVLYKIRLYRSPGVMMWCDAWRFKS